MGGIRVFLLARSSAQVEGFTVMRRRVEISRGLSALRYGRWNELNELDLIDWSRGGADRRPTFGMIPPWSGRHCRPDHGGIIPNIEGCRGRPRDGHEKNEIMPKPEPHDYVFHTDAAF